MKDVQKEGAHVNPRNLFGRVPPELAAALGELQRQAYLDSAVHWGLLGLATWAGAASLVIAWAKVSPTPGAGSIAAAVGALALAGAGVGWALGRPSVLQVARVADARLGLDERLASALAFAGTPGEMPERLVADAARRASEHRPVEAYPLRSHRRHAFALVVAAALLGALVFTPNPQASTLARRSADQAVIKEAKKTVVTAKERLAHEGAGAARAEQALAQAFAALERSRTPLQALAALSALEQQLASEGQNANQLQAAAAAASRALRYAPGAGQLAKDLSAANLKAAAADLRRLAKGTSKLSPAEQRELARALEQAAKDAGAKQGASNPAGRQNQSSSAQTNGATSFANELAQAAQALAAGQTARASKDLSSAANGATASAKAASLSQELAAVEAAVRNAESEAAAQAQAGTSGRGTARTGSPGPGRRGSKSGPVARYATGPGRGKSSGLSAVTGRGGGLGKGAGAGNGSGTSKGGTGAGRGNGSPDGSGAGKQPSDQVFVGGQPGSSQQVLGRHLASGYKVKTTNYKAVLPSFERTALQGLGSQVVDPADQDLVKNYFSSLGKN